MVLVAAFRENVFFIFGSIIFNELRQLRCRQINIKSDKLRSGIRPCHIIGETPPAGYNNDFKSFEPLYLMSGTGLHWYRI